MKHLSTEILNDYLDGELAPGARASAEAHLEACAACRAEAQALRRVIARVGALPQSIAPRQDLRPEIRARAAGSTVPRSPVRVPRWAPALAAAAVLVIAIGLGMRGGDRGAASSTVPDATANGPHAQVEQRYETVVAELAALVEERRAQVPAAVRNEIDATLAEIDSTLRESRVALERAPGDVELELGLSATYAQKIELLHQVLELTTTTE